MYRSFPNIYAIRGVEPRNAYSWYKSVERMQQLVEEHKIEHFAPSHSRHIVGTAAILSTLSAYRDGIAFVHDQTVRWLNQGLSADEMVAKIHASKDAELFAHPYLLEFYGTIEWSVRAIYMKHMGWFSGHVDELFPCDKHLRLQGTLKMLQFLDTCKEKEKGELQLARLVAFVEHYNEETRRESVATARDGHNRWLLEMTTQLLANSKVERGGGLWARVRAVRYAVMRDMASYQTSAPARNYLLTYWCVCYAVEV